MVGYKVGKFTVWAMKAEAGGYRAYLAKGHNTVITDFGWFKTEAEAKRKAKSIARKMR